MKLIDALLEKYKTLKPPNDTVRREICSVLEKRYNISVAYEKIKIKNGVVYIDAHPSIKNTLFINKQSILHSLNRTELVDIR